ncbi:MAG: class I SAM-dependent methyltransferase [Brevundimonas sp.]|nr:class I SAM-dependent methyltransferase [Brevundimonas sp.]
MSGISERYTEYAQEDYENFVNFEHPYWAITREIKKRGFDVRDFTVVDVCSGFGNTVIPLLKEYPLARVYASDLAKGMLKVLLREAVKHGVEDRVQAIVCNAQDSIWESGCADIVVGGAALHHMIDPGLAIAAALHALKPTGFAIFLEPLEAGHAILSLAFQEILRLPDMQKDVFEASRNMLSGIIKDIEARTHRTTRAIDHHWEQLDDKWLFPRSYLETIANDNGCTLEIYPLDESNVPFYTQAMVVLQNYAQLKFPECLPEAALQILERYDSAFSYQGKADVPLEGILVFTKIRENKLGF